MDARRQGRGSTLSAGVVSTLPAYAAQDGMVKPAAVEQHGKQRQAKYGERAVGRWKIGTGDRAVDPPQCAQPEEQKQSPGQGQEEVPREQRQAGNQRDVEQPPGGQRETVAEKQIEILGPPLPHLRE